MYMYGILWGCLLVLLLLPAPPDLHTTKHPFISLKNDEVINHQVAFGVTNYKIIANHDIWKQLLSYHIDLFLSWNFWPVLLMYLFAKTAVKIIDAISIKIIHNIYFCKSEVNLWPSAMGP